MTSRRWRKNDVLVQDKKRYYKRKLPIIQWLFRKAQEKSKVTFVYKAVYKLVRELRAVEISLQTKIGGGDYT